MKIGIEAVASCMPEGVVTLDDYAYLATVIPPDVEYPKEVRRLNDADAAEQLSVAVANQALEKTKLEPKDIDLIIAQQAGGRYFLPMIGTYVHDQVDFPQAIPVFNIQNACASMIDGLYLAWNMILSGVHKRALVLAVTALDTDGGWGLDRTAAVTPTMGDGAGAMIVSTENLKGEFLSYGTRTYGEIFKHMVTDLSPLENPELEPKDRPPRAANFHVDPIMFDWFQKHGTDLIRDSMRDALDKAGLDFPDIDFVFPHQCFRAAMDTWADTLEELGVSRDKWVESYDRFGNIAAVDVVPNLDEMDRDGKIPSGSILAFFPPGSGGHTPTMIVKWLG